LNASANNTSPLTWQIGSVCITAVVESVTTGISRFVLPQATPDSVEGRPWLEPFLDSERRLLMTIQSFLLQDESGMTLVDTCVGNDKKRRFREWNDLHTGYLERLAEAGATPSQIDRVLCTHMHIDHVGWNTRLVNGTWVPTFTNARYLFSRTEWEQWRHEPASGDPESGDTIIGDSVRPVFDAGLADLVETDHRVSDEIRLVHTPGHTPGHVSVFIESQGASALITGDMVHHPCQFEHPDWAASPDLDAEQSTATRRRVFSELADGPVLVLGSHFHAPTAGHVVRDGTAYRFRTTHDC